MTFDQRSERLIDLLDITAQISPHKRAIVEIGSREEVTCYLTYESLRQEARVRAVGLKRGVPAGGCLILAVSSAKDFAVAFWAAVYAGLTVVPICAVNARTSDATQRRVRSILRQCPGGLVLCDQAGEAWFRSEGAEVWSVGAGNWSTEWDIGADAPGEEAVAETVAVVQFTSGSTGDPKGVLLSASNIISNLDMIAATFVADGSPPVTFSWVPFYHDLGLIGAFLGTIRTGGTLIWLPTDLFVKNPLRWIRGMSDFRATLTMAPDSAYLLAARLLRTRRRETYDLSSLKVALNCSEPVSRHTIDEFTAMAAWIGFRKNAFTPCYGLAEATLLVASARLGEIGLGTSAGAPGCGHFVSCGYPPEGMTVSLIDSSGREILSDDVEGEIRIKGRSVSAGYWRRPDPDKGRNDGWLMTGDIGFRNAGGLYITGRVKDVIIRGGRNYHAVEIEVAIATSLDGRRSCCVAAFSDLTADGELIVVIVEAPEVNPVDIPDVTLKLRQVVLRDVGLVVDVVCLVGRGAVCRTPNGKIQRFATREKWRAGEYGPDPLRVQPVREGCAP